MESVVMVAALVLIFAVLLAKIVATQLLAHMNQRISHVAADKQVVLKQLKTAQSQKMVFEKNQRLLEKRKNKISNQINRLRKEMAGFREDEAARRQRSDARRVD